MVKYVLYTYAAITKEYTEASLDMKKQTLFHCSFRTSNHKTFSLLQGTSTFLVFASPRAYSNKSLVQKRRDLESFMAALSVQRKPGTIWVCMSPFLTAICIITSKSSFSKFLWFPVLCQWWDLVCTMENMLILSCAALVPLPSSPWQMCWGISMCLLGGMLELSVTAGAHSCTASLQSGFSWCSLLGKAEPRGKHDHSGFDSQTGECL